MAGAFPSADLLETPPFLTPSHLLTHRGSRRVHSTFKRLECSFCSAMNRGFFPNIQVFNNFRLKTTPLYFADYMVVCLVV